MNNQFDLRKFLTENKLTSNSQTMKEYGEKKPHEFDHSAYETVSEYLPGAIQYVMDNLDSIEDAKMRSHISTLLHSIDLYEDEIHNLTNQGDIKEGEHSQDFSSVDQSSVEVNLDDRAIEYAEWEDGTPLTDAELDEFSYSDLGRDYIEDASMNHNPYER